MKLLLLLIAALLFTNITVHGAFIVNHKTATASHAPTFDPAPGSRTAVVTSSTTHVKQPLIARLLSKARTYMPQGVYIILSVLFLGWLAIGINDDFKGTAWLLALLLYILLWLPGLIYSLIRMGKYYYR